eukprot:3078722-Rhodomonas_salina.1
MCIRDSSSSWYAPCSTELLYGVHRRVRHAVLSCCTVCTDVCGVRGACARALPRCKPLLRPPTLALRPLLRTRVCARRGAPATCP